MANHKLKPDLLLLLPLLLPLLLLPPPFPAETPSRAIRPIGPAGPPGPTEPTSQANRATGPTLPLQKSKERRCVEKFLVCCMSMRLAEASATRAWRKHALLSSELPKKQSRTDTPKMTILEALNTCLDQCTVAKARFARSRKAPQFSYVLVVLSNLVCNNWVYGFPLKGFRDPKLSGKGDFCREVYVTGAIWFQTIIFKFFCPMPLQKCM